MRDQVRVGISILAGLGLYLLGPRARGDDSLSNNGTNEQAPDWCARELLALSEGACAVVPAHLREPRTVVVFLHGVVKPDTNWQWAQQRALARAAHLHGFVGIMPRGRRSYGPRGMKNWWTWPTSAAGQRAFETELITEWTMAQWALEGALGAKFERRYFFGFSNGAYYASSLALRGRVQADGYGIFAGGSGASYLVESAKKVLDRPPIYVGYGHRDDSAKRDARELGAALRLLSWPSRVVERARVGHTMTDSMVAEALEFFQANETTAEP